MQRIDGKHLKHNCTQLGCVRKMTKDQLQERFKDILLNFSANEMKNPNTKASIVLAMGNIKKELANVAK